MAVSFPARVFSSSIRTYVFAAEVIRSLVRRIRLNAFYQRFHVLNRLAQKLEEPARPKLIVGIVHITSVEEHRDAKVAQTKVERLSATLDGLLQSFAHCSLTIKLITMPERHIYDYLPEHQRACVEVQEETGCDPMFIGYRVHELFLRHQDEFDWFLFLEDDIQIADPCMLEKLEKLSALPGMEKAILMPNRFEMWQGVKRYIDLTPFKDITWNKLSVVTVDGFKIAECSNPHAGLFCLSRRQMQAFAKSDRNWHGRDLYGGSRETAATFSLMEYFTLYKPHPENMYYFEVRHVDTKYSQLHPEPGAYCYSARVAPSAGRPAMEP